MRRLSELHGVDAEIIVLALRLTTDVVGSTALPITPPECYTNLLRERAKSVRENTAARPYMSD